MDIEKFDRLYPSPAHAAAADWSDRYLPKALKLECRSLLNDRSGTVIRVAALAAALVGGTAYVLIIGQSTKKRSVERTVQAVAAVPTLKRSASLPPVLPASAEPTSGLRRTIVEVSQIRPAPEREEPAHARKGSSGWILDPLSGEALAAALVIDKQRTVALNAQQLATMTQGEVRPTQRPNIAPTNEPSTS